MGGMRGLLEQMKGQFALAAPRHLTPDRVMRLAVNQFQRCPKLLDCTPKSVLGALMTCTQIGLEPDDAGGRAYLIPYKDVCTLVIGYKGLIELAHRSEKLSTVEARVVREDDVFEVRLGTDATIKHLPALGSDRPLVAAYAVATMRDGGKQFEVMSRREIEAIRGRSSSANASYSPWKSDYEEMARKTVTRRLCKYLPSSAELQRAVALDEQQDAGLPQDLTVVGGVEEPSNGTPRTLDATVPEARRRGRPPKAAAPKPTEAEAPVEPDVIGPAADGELCSPEFAAKLRSGWKLLTPDQRAAFNKNYGRDLGAEALKARGFENWTLADGNDLSVAMDEAVETGR